MQSNKRECRHHIRMKGGAITLETLKLYAIRILDANPGIADIVKNVKTYIYNFESGQQLDNGSPMDRTIGNRLIQILRDNGDDMFLEGNLTSRNTDDYNEDLTQINRGLNHTFQHYTDIRRREINSKTP